MDERETHIVKQESQILEITPKTILTALWTQQKGNFKPLNTFYKPLNFQLLHVFPPKKCVKQLLLPLEENLGDNLYNFAGEIAMHDTRVKNHSSGLIHSFFQLLRLLATDSLVCPFQDLTFCYSMLLYCRWYTHHSGGKPHPITDQCRSEGIKSRFPLPNFSQFSRTFQHQSSPMELAEACLETVKILPYLLLVSEVILQ